MDDPKEMPALQAYLQRIEQRLATLAAVAGKPSARLFSTVAPTPAPGKTAGWGC